MKTITADDGSENSVANLSLSKGPTRDTAVTVQGDANDFVWSIQQSHNGNDWVSMKDGEGLDSFTGCQPKKFDAVPGFRYRVIVTDLGTATHVFVGND